MRAFTWANQRKVIACCRHWARENAKDHVIFRSYCYIWLGEKCGAMFPSQSRKLRFTFGLDRKPQSFANKFTDDSHGLTRFATVNGLDVKLSKNCGNHWSPMTHNLTTWFNLMLNDIRNSHSWKETWVVPLKFIFAGSLRQSSNFLTTGQLQNN